MKPSASRNESSETYYLCQGFDRSQDPVAVKVRALKDSYEAAESNPQEQARLLDEVANEQLGYLKDLIEHAHKHGLDVPEKLKAHIKTTSLG